MSVSGEAVAPVAAGFDPGALKRFLGKCALMIALQVATGVAILLLIPPDREDYLAIIGRKVELIEQTPPPRIVFVGGSNLAFGLDSDAVEKALGRHVVNMGMGFNMGLRFMLDLVAPRIREGDLVVLIPEYNLFYGLLDGDERLIDVLELYPEGVQYLHSRRQFTNLVENLPRHARFKVARFLQTVGREPPSNCVYCPGAFNEHGDAVAHLDLPGKDVAKMEFLRSTSQGVDLEAIDVVNGFAKKVEQAGAKVVMLYPCVPEYHFEKRHEAIANLDRRLHERLAFPLLSTPADYAYPDGNFYDWVYHLNRAGRATRTARVIEQIRPALESGGAARS